MPGAASRLEAAGGPEPLPPVLGLRAHVDDGDARRADRAAHGGVVRAHVPVFRGQGAAGGGRLGRRTAPGTAVIPPRVAGAVEDAHVGVAVQLHQPETHGGPVPVAHHRRVRADPGTGQEPLHRRGVDEPVVGVLEVGVDVPQHGPVDVPLVVGKPAHVDLDHPHPGVVPVRFQPVGRYQNVRGGVRVAGGQVAGCCGLHLGLRGFVGSCGQVRGDVVGRGTAGLHDRGPIVASRSSRMGAAWTAATTTGATVTGSKAHLLRARARPTPPGRMAAARPGTGSAGR